MRVLLLLAPLVSCSQAPSAELLAARGEFTPEELARILACGPLPAVEDPTNAALHGAEAFALGRALFYDPRLSGDGDTSCSTCHDPARDWTDGLQHPIGGVGGPRDTPSLWNAALNRWFFWDGRADSLWAQALGPIENPLEMGGKRGAVASLIAEDPALQGMYGEAFGTGPSASVDRVFANVGKALAAFEARILTQATPFDRFVRGLNSGDAEDLAVLQGAARAGAKLFFGAARCHLCHHGAQLSDLEFHDIRLPGVDPAEQGRFGGIKLVQSDPFNGLGEHSDDPEGARTKLSYLARNPHQRGEWKTPGLRNVARTAPYMHNGVYPDLASVVEHYSTLADAPGPAHPGGEQILVPLDLSVQEKLDLVAFLEALSSPPPAAYLLSPGGSEQSSDTTSRDI